MQEILEQYGIDAKGLSIKKFGTGLINHTWLLENNTGKYILQRVNEHVFKKPLAIAHNIDQLAAYFKTHYPAYLFVSPVHAGDGSSIVKDSNGGCYRLFPFVKGSCSVDVVSTPGQAYAAAAQFGKFTRLLDGFDASQLITTTPEITN